MHFVPPLGGVIKNTFLTSYSWIQSTGNTEKSGRRLLIFPYKSG